MRLDSGRRIGAYEIVGPLGSGGMGEVYRARDTRLGRSVAIKLVSAEIVSDPVAHERLEREARLTSSLNHPNIVTVYDVGEVDGHPFIVMELVAGETLHARLATRRLKLKEVVDIAAQVTEGLAAAHGAGVVHRDLKPRNIMLMPDGRAKIVDFGLGKSAPAEADPDESTAEAHGLTGPYAIVGTAGYMSPEQVTGRPVDFRCDQFAVGSIVYEMLTGRRAFKRDTPVQTMAAVADAEPESLADSCPSAPVELLTIVDRCLAKDPAGRYASTADLARDLRDVHASLSSGHSSSRPRRPAIRVGRARWSAAIAVVTLALATWTVGNWQPSPLEEAQALLVRYDRADNVTRAVDILDTAVAETPGDVALRTSLAEALWRQYEHTNDRSLIDRAGAEIASALEIDERYAPAHVVLAMISSKQGRYAGGLAEATRAIELAPESGTAYREFARANVGLGQNDEAEQALLDAVRLAPDDWTVQNDLGTHYYRLGRLEEAAAQLQKALALSPGNTKIYTNLGGILQRLKRWDEAAAALEVSSSLFTTAGNFSNLGSLHYRQGRYADAARWFERAVALPDADSRHWRNLASAANRVPAMRNRAMEAYARAAEIGEAELTEDPANQDVLANLAASYVALGRTDEARQLLDRLEHTEPTSSDVLVLMATTYEGLSDRTRALESLGRAVDAGLTREELESSPSLVGLRTDERFREYVK